MRGANPIQNQSDMRCSEVSYMQEKSFLEQNFYFCRRKKIWIGSKQQLICLSSVIACGDSLRPHLILLDVHNLIFMIDTNSIVQWYNPHNLAITPDLSLRYVILLYLNNFTICPTNFFKFYDGDKSTSKLARVSYGKSPGVESKDGYSVG